MTHRTVALAAVVVTSLVALAPSPARAGELKLSVRDGRVTVIADQVTVRQILDEWARVGQIKIVNGEKLTGAPLTLRLENVPEREALGILLRTAAGYVAAPRPMANASLSAFDRIIILATSRPPAVSASVPPPFNPRPTPFPTPTPPPVAVDDDPGEPGDQQPPPGVVPGVTATQPGLVPNPGGTYVQPQTPGQQPPPMTLPRPGLLPQPQPTPPNPYVPGRPTPPTGRGGGPGDPGGGPGGSGG
jgi:hypothetical protein